MNTSAFTIYGVWFFPERDRNKIFKILERLVQYIFRAWGIANDMYVTCLQRTEEHRDSAHQ